MGALVTAALDSPARRKARGGQGPGKVDLAVTGAVGGRERDVG